jgi:hypothetical protein
VPPPPPPQPPPHRHGNKETQSPGPSGEKSRRSTDSVRRGSGASSVSQVERVESNPGSHDILADLSALQRDIDALRSQSAGERVT